MEEDDLANFLCQEPNPKNPALNKRNTERTPNKVKTRPSDSQQNQSLITSFVGLFKQKTDTKSFVCDLGKEGGVRYDKVT